MMSREAEELARTPYEEEMFICDYLVSYLQKTFLSNPNTPNSDKPAASSVATAVDDDSGLKVHSRELDNFFICDTKKRGKKKGGNNSKKETVVHSVDALEYFSSIGVVPPTTVSSVPNTITLLQEKKRVYETTERGVILSIADKRRGRKLPGPAPVSGNTVAATNNIGGTDSRSNKKSGTSKSNNSANGPSSKVAGRETVFNFENDFPSLGGSASTAAPSVPVETAAFAEMGGAEIGLGHGVVESKDDPDVVEEVVEEPGAADEDIVVEA